MPTTIQVGEKTLRLLRRIKEKFKAKTYDEAINRLISKKTDIPRSMFGVHPDAPPFTEDDRFKAHDEE